MWFAILGPLLVHDGETPAGVPQGRLRVLLSALLLQAGKPVAAGALAEAVWDGSPPPGAEVTLRSHVVRLRRALGPRAGARLVTRRPGYLFQAGEDEVDVLRFRGLCRDGGAALREGAWARADALLGEALGLWRGAPLTDAPCALLREKVPGLEELRLQAEEWRADAALHLDRHTELIPGLQSMASQHPLRERFHGQLMLALYRSGRQAEALAAYQRARDVLVAELGTEPGPGLRELQQRILSADPALAIPETARPAEGGSERAVPRELPPAVPGFTGRAAELEALTRLLDQAGGQAPGAVVISAIGGTAGVGKTALALHWAHQMTARFPDGQLYVNLRGYDPGPPMPAADALAGFLRSLGVPGQDIPPEPDQRAARYRSLLAGKRTLVVLDNAGSADQVRPLLPGTAACTVVVTSRDALPGLVARDGAARLDLDILPLEDAVALLRTLIGARAAAEPDAAAELAEQCCRLPLALRVAAELAASRPGVPLAALTGELADLRTRLDLLAADGDARTQVRAVFSWSCRHLHAEDARAFRLLGLHPGPDLEPYAAAALTGTTVPQARRALDVLARAHLIQPAGLGRYGMHDLLRGYARELADATDGEKEQNAALTRLFDHYLHAAAAAMDILFPAERHRRPRIPRPATPVPPLADPVTAQEWLDGERAALVTAAGHTAACDWPGHATQLASTLAGYFVSAGHIPEIISIYNHALATARRIGDSAAKATALGGLGFVAFNVSHFQQAADYYQQSLDLFREAGDRVGEARAMGSLCAAERELGRNEQSARHAREAVVICRDIRYRSGEAVALSHLGHAREGQGNYREAANYHQQALDLARKIGDHECEAYALASLGSVGLKLRHYQPAARYFEQALALYQEIGDRLGEARSLTRLGTAYAGLNGYEQAISNLGQALAIFRELNYRIMEASALNRLGDLFLQTGDAEKARTHHAAALRLASEAPVAHYQAQAHSGLARAYYASGDSVQARRHWQQALTLYIAIGAPAADEVRAKLATTGDDSDEDHCTRPGVVGF